MSRVTAVRGVHHVALRSSDLDRQVAFYTRLGARVGHDGAVDGRRLIGLELGGGSILELSDGEAGLHHVALAVPSHAAFVRLRDALVAGGSTDGAVRDFGKFWALRFVDPDGLSNELVWTIRPACGYQIPRPLTSTQIDAGG